MLLRMLKKDLLRKKAMNAVLFLFIVLCSALIGAGVGNMATMQGAVEHFKTVSKVADYYLAVPNLSSDEQLIDSWIASSDIVTDAHKSYYANFTQDKTRFNGDELASNSGNITYTTVPQNGNYVFTENDERITNLQPGEIALSYNLAQANGLKVGDVLTLDTGSTTTDASADNTIFEFKIVHLMKDFLFGSDFMTFTLAVVSDADFARIAQGEHPNPQLIIYSLYTNDLNTLLHEKNMLSYNSVFELVGSQLGAAFIMEMITSAILLLVALIFITVALVLLHFTIAFTMQEDYREIGIMKGIGVADIAIKRLYITKYLYLAMVGALIGLVLSFLISNLLLAPLRNTIVMGGTIDTFWLHVACAALVVVLCVVFAWLGTHRVRRLSAIQAIRSGSTGERFSRKGFLHLSQGDQPRASRLSVPAFLAINDIFCGLRNFVALVVALALGILMVNLPANAANTLGGSGVIPYFFLSDFDVAIDTMQFNDNAQRIWQQQLQEDKRELERQANASGIAMKFEFMFFYTSKLYVSDPMQAVSTQGMCSTNEQAILTLPGLEGTQPRLDNEIAMTRLLMADLGVDIGDTVHVVVGQTSAPYLITGSFETMTNLGRTFCFASTTSLIDEPVSTVMAAQGSFDDNSASPSQISAQIQELRQRFSSYQVYAPDEYVTHMIGDIKGTIVDVKNMILLLVLAVIFLVVTLLARTLLARDLGELALLKTLGFRTSTLFGWQILRMLAVAVVALAVGLVLTLPLNTVMVRFTFGLMGAPTIPATIEPVETFLLYPALLLLIALLATVLGVVRTCIKANKDNLATIE
jgi:putative ABC transport system permease protein